MKMEEILNLDCTVEGNKNILNKFLWKVKSVQELGIPRGSMLHIDDLECVMHDIETRYNYRIQEIKAYYIEDEVAEKAKFIFYTVNVIKYGETDCWIGCVYGKTMWEITAKIIIKMYVDIMNERKE